MVRCIGQMDDRAYAYNVGRCDASYRTDDVAVSASFTRLPVSQACLAVGHCRDSRLLRRVTAARWHRHAAPARYGRRRQRRRGRHRAPRVPRRDRTRGRAPGWTTDRTADRTAGRRWTDALRSSSQGERRNTKITVNTAGRFL